MCYIEARAKVARKCREQSNDSNFIYLLGLLSSYFYEYIYIYISITRSKSHVVQNKVHISLQTRITLA